MKTVVDSLTGEVLFPVVIENYEGEGQTVIDELPSPEFENPYWDFANNEFFNKFEA